MKVTEEQKQKIKKMYKSGKKFTEISRELKIPLSTVQYHANESYRIKTRERAREYSKKNPRKNTEERREYMRNYMRDYLKKRRKNETNTDF
jgi:fructose-1,6-bisphosphatase